ncbi:MobF family relaxase [Pelagicoccus sp. SDUM812002]|uniref:MobF family relaxase n=1 Tax=Pelagicoccus sp. SDUM812002 TaxID=3041266 RepID=UPI002812488F|nr:MobF family relaxase [Pelagicoccus sp. SDUM812002]
MISPKAQYNLRNAQRYFREHLQVGDYYAQENAVQGEWFGLGAERLDLNGPVQEKDFLALCEGLNPANGERLTLRKNTTRLSCGKETANRRIFYDFTISPPKSVSIVALYQDERIVRIHDEAIRKSMHEMEKFAMTRVRKGGVSDDRETGNVVGAYFRHDTSRALDPHLHTHCIVMNATFDPFEKRWKALQNYQMLKAQKFVENLYYHELSKGLRKLGYAIENNARDFEIRGVSRSLIETFSKRNRQIDEAVAEHISKGKFVGNVKELRAQIAHEKRDRKMRGASAEKLSAMWDEQMIDRERAILSNGISGSFSANTKPDITAVVDWADEHMFERKSVVEDYQLKAAALVRGRGERFSLEELEAEIVRREYLKNDKGYKITTRLTLGRELELVHAAWNGKGICEPFCETYEPSIPTVTEEQKLAIERILTSRDRVVLFRGGAGTGKSFALKEVERGLKRAGFDATVLAPQRQQVIDLEKDGFKAQTVASFLTKCELPERAVVVVDEAGQIGGKQMSELFRAAEKADARIILSGDTRQHGAVEASDALRAIELHSGLEAAELEEIRRQDPDGGKDEVEREFIRDYRGAVKAASAEQIYESFERLDALGCVEEYAEAVRKEVLASDYLAAKLAGENVLVVAQTWDEINAVNRAVRRNLKASGMLGKDSRLEFYQSRDLGEAQKRDARFYRKDDHVCFVRSYGRFRKGDFAKVRGAGCDGLKLDIDGKVTTVAFKQAKRFMVVESKEMELARGDRLQMKFNDRSLDGKPVVNGELVTVSRIWENGNISVRDDKGIRKTLSPNQRLANLGYAVTSYASQGKTVDTVLFSDSRSKAATNRNQWYVSISRARKRIKIYTSDKDALSENLLRSGDRQLALDIAGSSAEGGSGNVRGKVEKPRRLVRWTLSMARKMMAAARWKGLLPRGPRLKRYR